MNTCILLLASILPGAEPPPRPEASRVSLDGKPIPLADAVAQISQQANIPVAAEKALKDKTVQFKLDQVPFWDALDQLARTANHRLVVSSQGRRIALACEPYQSRPTSLNGIYRFALREVSSRLDLESGSAHTSIVIDMAWEPKFKAYFVELDPKSLSARDDQNRPLAIVDEGTSRMPVTESGPDLTLKLRQVPRSAKAIAELSGAVKFLGTAQSLRFDFDLSPKGERHQKRAEVSATLRPFAKNVRLWTFVVEMQYPKDMPEFESFQSFLLDNQAWLQGPDGRKFATRKFELGFERQGKAPITYYVQENDKDGPVLTNPADWKLVLRVPGRIIEEKVRFQLRDIPLP